MIANRSILLSISFIFLFLSVNALAKKPPVMAGNTQSNLMVSYNNERNANVRYQAYAKKADEEGYHRIASLFRAAARSERVQFENFGRVINKYGGTPDAKIEQPIVKSTKENLEEAIRGESYEHKVLYSKFADEAKKDKNRPAKKQFEYAREVEKVHNDWFTKALENMDDWKTESTFYVCPICGNLLDRNSDGSCDICGTSLALALPIK